jgi:hypothetical protein
LKEGRFVKIGNLSPTSLVDVEWFDIIFLTVC